MKKILFFIMGALLALNINAQTAVETTKITDNVYIGVNAGVATPLSFNSVFPLNSTVGLRLGKDLTPVFGLNVEGTAWLGSASDGQTRFDNPIGHNTFRAINTGLNGTVNLNNLLLGYNGTPRTFEVSTITGFGWLHVFNPSYTGFKDYNALTAKTGIDLTFNLGKSKAHQLYIEPAVLWNLNGRYKSSDIKFNKHLAQLGLSIGYTYKFKTTNGTHNFKTYDVGALNAEIASLKSKLAEKPTEVVKYVEKKVEVPAANAVATAPCGVYDLSTVVSFAFRDATLTDDAKAELADVIAFAKADSLTLDVTGYASRENTAGTAFNLNLSKERAEAVAKYLKENGVKVGTVKGVGDENETSQRTAVVTVAK